MGNVVEAGGQGEILAVGRGEGVILAAGSPVEGRWGAGTGEEAIQEKGLQAGVTKVGARTEEGIVAGGTQEARGKQVATRGEERREGVIREVVRRAGD